jgi:LppP/LprE lipoprotein
MREQAREREEHPAGEERRRTNGRARHSDAHGPPRRPSRYVAPRPPKRPRGRVAKSFVRVVGLLATAVLLAVGVAVVLMVTRENPTEPAQTFAAPNPTPAPRKTKTPARPRGQRLSPAQKASRDAAVKQLRSQGYEPTSLAVYKPRQSLRVLVGRPKATSGIRGRRAFFFVHNEYLGTDAAEPSLRVRVLRQTGSTITLQYILFSPGDTPEKPTGGRVNVRFTIADGRLVPQDAIPPVVSRLPSF